MGKKSWHEIQDSRINRWGWGIKLRNQVIHELLSAGEHVPCPEAGPPPDVFLGPAALTAARSPEQPEDREEKDSTFGP